MSALRAWYLSLTTDDAVHWDGANFQTHGGSSEGTNDQQRVTCPFCISILSARGLDAWEAKRREIQTQVQDALGREGRRALDEHHESIEWDQIRRDRERERRGAEQAKRDERNRRRRAARRGLADRDSLVSRDRKTRLTESQQALDGWPDVDLDQAWEAINELRDDQRQDPAHWINLRRFRNRGELQF